MTDRKHPLIVEYWGYDKVEWGQGSMGLGEIHVGYGIIRCPVCGSLINIGGRGTKGMACSHSSYDCWDGKVLVLKITMPLETQGA